jgi:HEAT repeat-containing protein 5
MEAKDPHILAAMDGKEVSKQNPQLVLTTDRKEPTAFFFVIFGLVYEALATASADASSESRSGVISALTALKLLVRPEYSGQAIMEPTIFEEFISLCYRMSMTEAAGIQIHLIEMLAIFAAAQQHSQSTGLDVLSLTSPPAHCLRICSHVLKQATSPSRASSTRKLHFLTCICYVTEIYSQRASPQIVSL